MNQLQIEGINDNKPITIERVNLEAMDEVKKLQGLDKNDPEAMRGITRAALLSSNSLDFNAPDYRLKIETYIRRMKLEDTLILIKEFMTVNDDFFHPKSPALAVDTKVPQPDISSVPPSNTPSNTLTASNTMTQ